MKGLEFWFCFLIVGALLFIIGRVPLAEAAVQQLDDSVTSVTSYSNPVQTIGGITGTLSSLTIHFASQGSLIMVKMIVREYDTMPEGAPNGYSQQWYPISDNYMRDGTSATFTASEYSTPVVFNPDKYYAFMFYQMDRYLQGSGSDVLQGKFYSTGTTGNTTEDPNVKDMYFDLQGVSPAPPVGGISISNLGQFKSDATSTIPEGGATTEGMIVFGATLQSSSTDPLQLQVEVQPSSTPFTNQPTATSTFIDPGGFATTTVTNLPNGQYHWQARAVDSQNNVSEWQEFGTPGNIDFEVSMPLSTKAVNLAKLVINGPYLGDGDTFGGKGWDPVRAEYVTSSLILSGYQYWNNKLRIIAFGAGLDCSGLVQWAFNRSFDPKKSLLKNVVRYDGADGQYKNNSENIAEADLRPADLLFLDKDGNGGKDHVAMYVGDNGTFDVVEAHSPARGIITSNKAEFKTRAGFIGNQGFRRVIASPSIGGQVKVSSPIDLIVTDPDGFTITPTTVIQTDEEYLREVPGELYYTENVLGIDGRPEDIVYWPAQKIGNYSIKVLPEADAMPTETYSMEFTVGEQTIVLADDVHLDQIPLEGYGVNIASSGAISTFVPVAIDIKPNSFPNSINLGSKGTTPVAILGSATLDVKQIDPNTIKLANAPIKLKNNGKLMTSYEDVNGDGFTDMVVHIITAVLQLAPSDVKAELSGFLLDRREIKGSDSVKIVP
ncbi:MAG: NlpC/P60 family protein [Candidatus Jorgensenbacteria bacterium]